MYRAANNWPQKMPRRGEFESPLGAIELEETPMSYSTVVSENLAEVLLNHTHSIN